MTGPTAERIEAPVLDGKFLSGIGIGGINCGCGTALAGGCLNVDQLSFSDRQGTSSEPGKLLRIRHGEEVLYYMQHDMAQAFPIAGQSFSWGYSEHFIEHLSLEQAISWLREMRRLIAPGGLLRVTTPDLKKYVQGYADPEERFFNLHRDRMEALELGEGWVSNRRAWMVNQIFQFYGHRWIYDFDEIVHAASAAGFDPKGISQSEYRAGKLEEAFMLDSPTRNDETLYVDIRA